MSASPLPLRHLRPVTLAKLRQRAVERCDETCTAGPVRMLWIGTPIRTLRQYCFHDLRLQIPNLAGGLAKPAEQHGPGKRTQPGREQQRLYPIGIHAKIPPAQPLDRLAPEIAFGL